MKKFISVLSVIVLVVAGCTGEKVKPVIDKSITGSEIPVQESWKPVITFLDSGRTRALLKPGHLQMFSKRHETILDDGMLLEFLSPSGTVSTTITSKRGKVDETTKDLYAYENVIARNDSGVVLETEELMWNNKEEKIMTDKFVRITTRTEKIEGYGFKSDQHIRNYVIYRITYNTSTGQ